MPQTTFPPPRAYVRVFLQLKAIVGVTNDFDLAMGEQSLRSGRSRILAGTVVAAVDNPTRELLVGLNDARYRGLQLIPGGSERYIGFH